MTCGMDDQIKDDAIKQGWGHEGKQAKMINSAWNVSGKFWLWHPAVSWKYKSEKLRRDEVRDPSLKSGATKVDEVAPQRNELHWNKKGQGLCPREHGTWTLKRRMLQRKDNHYGKMRTMTESHDGWQSRKENFSGSWERSPTSNAAQRWMAKRKG